MRYSEFVQQKQREKGSGQQLQGKQHACLVLDLADAICDKLL